MRAALESVPGVRKIEVRFDEREALVEAERKSLDTKAMIEALRKAGYEASVKEKP